MRTSNATWFRSPQHLTSGVVIGSHALRSFFSWGGRKGNQRSSIRAEAALLALGLRSLPFRRSPRPMRALLVAFLLLAAHAEIILFKDMMADESDNATVSFKNTQDVVSSSSICLL